MTSPLMRPLAAFYDLLSISHHDISLQGYRREDNQMDEWGRHGMTARKLKNLVPKKSKAKKKVYSKGAFGETL